MPRLEILVGMIASGKSTYAKGRAAQGALVVSHDQLTEMVHQEYRYEPELRACYSEMLAALVFAGLKAGRDVVVDRTHLTVESRRFWIGAAAAARVPVHACVFPIESPGEHANRRVLADGRGRPFEEWLAVANHHAGQIMDQPFDRESLLAEGFDQIIRMGAQGESPR